MSKQIKFLSLSLIVILGLFTSCSKKSDPVNNPSNDSNWKFGAYTYTKGGSSQDTKGQFVAIVVSTSGNGGNYGAYSGSALTFTFPNNLGAGKYTLTSEDLMVASPGTKLMQVDCTIGTAVNTGAILYSSDVNSATTADVTIDTDGKYHITIANPVVLVKNVTVGNGIPGAATSYSLTVNNAY